MCVCVCVYSMENILASHPVNIKLLSFNYSNCKPLATHIHTVYSTYLHAVCSMYHNSGWWKLLLWEACICLIKSVCVCHANVRCRMRVFRGRLLHFSWLMHPLQLCSRRSIRWLSISSGELKVRPADWMWCGCVCRAIRWEQQEFNCCVIQLWLVSLHTRSLVTLKQKNDTVRFRRRLCFELK